MADQRDGGISWTDETWNPIRGCSRVSEGCRNCYAETMAARFTGPGMAYEGLAQMTPSGPRWTGEVRLIEKHLEDPLRWKRPRRIFTNSMSDLFHEKLTDEQIDRVFAVMALAPQHTFQVLTKRAERMYAYMTAYVAGARKLGDALGQRDSLATRLLLAKHGFGVEVGHPPPYRPPSHIWLGVSVEDQKTADERIPWLLKTPAAVRFVSYEPALGPVNVEPYLGWNAAEEAARLPEPLAGALLRLGDVHGVDWVIVGGESGPGARPFDVQWARDTIAQCRAAGVPVFVKQLGSRPETRREIEDIGGRPFISRKQVQLKDKKGGDISEWPLDIRVREFPEVAI